MNSNGVFATIQTARLVAMDVRVSPLTYLIEGMVGQGKDRAVLKSLCSSRYVPRLAVGSGHYVRTSGVRKFDPPLGQLAGTTCSYTSPCRRLTLPTPMLQAPASLFFSDH